MLLSHHPSLMTRQAYADGELAAGAARVVAIHLEYCHACAAQVEPRSRGARIATAAYPEPRVRPSDRLVLQDDRWSCALQDCRIGPWMWAGFGMRIAHLPGASGLGEHLYLLKAKPGSRTPAHRHEGRERVVVLQGAFVDGASLYCVGDVAESDSPVFHELQATQDGVCVCLIAADGSLKTPGLGGWVRRRLRL